MSKQTVQPDTVDTEQATTDDARVPVADATAPLNRQKRSADTDSATDRKHGTGGLDSLGGGRLP